MKNHKNIAIILAFLLPIILILIVVLSVYLPSAFLSTKYNFIYASCNTNYSYDCSSRILNHYKVVEGKLVLEPFAEKTDSNSNGLLDEKEIANARFFLHDTQKNESREISLQEVKSMTLNGLITSPDNVSVSSGYERGVDFMLISGRSTYENYLVKGNSKTKLNLIKNSEYYYNNIHFIGWVLPGRN